MLIIIPVAILHALLLLIPLNQSIHTTQIEIVLQPHTDSQNDMLWTQSEGFEEYDLYTICELPELPDER
jgi:hypothetical protein